MKLNSTINRYIFMQMIPPFLISIAFFSFLFLMAQLLNIINLIVNYGVGFSIIFLMLVYLIPTSMIYVLPLSILITILLTFLQLSSDNEIIALKSVGISIYQVVMPVFLFCLIGYALTVFMTSYAAPQGRYSLKKLTRDLLMSNIDVALKERVFNDEFGERVLYINKIDMKENKLQDIFIEDKSSKEMVMTIVAPSGKIIRGKNGKPGKFILYNGIMNQVTIGDNLVNTIQFKTYDFVLDPEKTGIPDEEVKKGKSTSLNHELRAYLREKEAEHQLHTRYYRSLMEYYKRYSIPVSCFIFGLLALPLGFQSSTIGRATGLLSGILCFMMFYLILMVGNNFGDNGAYPPIIGMWMPNVLLGALGIYLFMRVANEDPLFFDIEFRFFKWIRKDKSDT